MFHEFLADLSFKPAEVVGYFVLVRLPALVVAIDIHPVHTGCDEGQHPLIGQRARGWIT